MTTVTTPLSVLSDADLDRSGERAAGYDRVSAFCLSGPGWFCPEN